MTKYALLLSILLLATACRREPELHLYDEKSVEIPLVFAELELDIVWDYILEDGTHYDWRTEWFYGWDDEDRQIFGEIGYTKPDVFNIRQYFTGNSPYGHHLSVRGTTIEGNFYRSSLGLGFWDLLAYNDIKLIDGVQSINFDETTTLDSITVHTNPSMNAARYHAPRFTHSFYEPEELFAAYEQAIEINRNLDGFVFDPELNAYVMRLNMLLTPITYIYLMQIIVHHNKGRIVGVDGSGNLSGMARSSVLNSGRAGNDAVTVAHKMRWKRNCDMRGENVDIAGGRTLTFGICGQCSGRLKSYHEVHDNERHFLDLKMQFNNGLDSTFVFDVTDQVRQRYKGGVLTVEIDMDTIPIPRRSGGSAFDAVVEEYREETHEFGL